MKNLKITLDDDDDNCSVIHDGKELKQLCTRIDISKQAFKPVEVKLFMHNQTKMISGDGSWVIADPDSGEIRPVKRIEYVDGTVWEDCK